MVQKALVLLACFALTIPSANAQSQVDFRESLRMTFPATVTVAIPGQEMRQARPRRRQQPMMNGFLMGMPQASEPPIVAGFAISGNKVITQILGNADNVIVTTFDRSQHDGTVIARDNVTGLCVVQLDDEAALVSLVVGDGIPEPGLPVVTTWLANGVGNSKSGMISSPPSSAQPSLGFTQQLDCGELNVSGGPVVDADGVLVGITVTSDDGSVVCMPASQLTRLMDLGLGENPKDLNRGVVGIQFQSNAGPIVNDVNADSPASKAGLQQGDRISQINDHSIFSYQDVIAAVAMARSGDALQITFDRDGETKECTVTLGDHPQQRRVTMSALEPDRNGGAERGAAIFGQGQGPIFQQQGWILKDGKLVPMELDNDGGAEFGFPKEMEDALRQMEVFPNFRLPRRLNGFQFERSDAEEALQRAEERAQELQRKLDQLESK